MSVDRETMRWGRDIPKVQKLKAERALVLRRSAFQLYAQYRISGNGMTKISVPTRLRPERIQRQRSLKHSNKNENVPSTKKLNAKT